MPATVSTPEPWDFAGWGKAARITDLDQGPTTVTRLDQPRKHTLGTWRATAICGNDITSSVLYVSALCAAQAGALAPIVLLIVAGVLYLYRRIYAEVGSALPLNGGSYTVLLNTTGKRIAAAAAVLTLLSYIATAVISANEAMHYAHNLVAGLDIIPATVGVLGVFAVLNLVGITESAVVALGIFVLHMATLTVLAVAAGIAVVRDPSVLAANWAIPPARGIGGALFFGFAAAMLGISGFESSANFIEEQQAGVFPKTLRNMWVAVSVFNPLMALLALGLLPLAVIQGVPQDLLARMGTLSLGPALGWWVSLDAVLVLSGAVLTSYVGVTGLVRRMALDRCLPQVLLAENRFRKTNHWIILGFFGLCTSILFVTEGDIGRLAGVYTLSFLSVMALYAIGNMLLKKTRGRLPRAVQAAWPAVLLALAAVMVGIIGNVFLDPGNVRVFSVYYVIGLAVVAVMFLRVELLRVLLSLSRAVVDRVTAVNDWVRKTVYGKIEEISGQEVVYFTKGDDISILNRAALYVLKNEQTHNLKVVHAYEEEGEIPQGIAGQLATIDHLYPQLKIDFLAVRGAFGPELIERLSRRLGVPKNAMFIGTPGDRFPHRVEDLGGVRIIL
ncbi:MAG TPA: APC family permease [Longimicrobiales bacterium]|nr:APC family permease [Longimicrobiales bacterium]